jgi:diguanylate cyclase (GGDEF)-like protein
MVRSRWFKILLAADDDVLAPYRGRLALPLTWVCAGLMVPMLVLHLVNQNLGLAAITLVGQGLAVLSGLALRSDKVPPLALTPAMLVVIAAIDVSVSRQGASGLFGAYPALVIAHFILPRPAARLCAALLIVSIGLIGSQSLGPSITIRAVGTLLLLVLMIEVVLNVVGELQRALALEAHTDALTGAHDRRELGRWLGGDAAKAIETSSQGMALLAIDIDRFKGINDHHGHAAGDQVLVDTVRTLRAALRPADRLFRMGGEEFLLALPDTSPGDAAQLAEGVRQQIEAAPLLQGKAGVTVSIGLAHWAAGGSGEQALQEADRALYAAKAAGRNCTVPAYAGSVSGSG